MVNFYPINRGDLIWCAKLIKVVQRWQIKQKKPSDKLYIKQKSIRYMTGI
jgi:hypothetical protein